MKTPSSLSRRGFIAVSATATSSLLIPSGWGAEKRPRVVVWSENSAPVDKVYPKDINTAIAEGLRTMLPDWQVETASIEDPEQGCSEASLAACDVLIWWGHKRHGEVKDEYVDRVEKRVRDEGMGFISVHSSHFAKTNKRLMGTPCSWAAYKNDGCKLRVEVKPDHPITRGVDPFTLPAIERYSEPYQVPTPDSVPLTGSYIYPDGHEEPTRVGFCWTIGRGRMFYFAPGHETYQTLYRPDVQRIFANAVQWAKK